MPADQLQMDPLVERQWQLESMQLVNFSPFDGYHKLVRPLKKGGRFALMDIFNEAHGFKDMDNMLYKLENNGVSEISTEYIFKDLEKAEEFKKAGIWDARLIYGIK